MQQFRDYEAFWPYYVGQHLNATNRALHLVGTSLALGCALAVPLGAPPAALLLAPLLGYGFAWLGHFGFEGNRPATFGHPLWSLRSDLRMYRLMLLGRMQPELKRARASLG